MATLKLALDLRRAKKDGTFPVVFKLTMKRSQTFISTGYSLKPQEFNASTGFVKNKPQINEYLLQLEAEYKQRLHIYLNKYRGVETISNARKFLIERQISEYTVYEFWENTILEMKTAGRFGGVTIYQQSLNTISKEMNLHIPFQDLTYTVICALETKLYDRGMSINGAGVYLRTLKSVCNKAINQDIVTSEWYPFRKFKVRKEKTVPRVLALDELKFYFGCNLSKNSPLYKAWNIGKLLFMLRGINIRDLLLLNPESIKNGRIIYKRAKTGKIYSIKLNEDIESVLAVFEANETMLGLIDTEKISGINGIKYLKQKVKVVNNHLNKLGLNLNLKQPLTTYVFRYSYANAAKQLGYSKDLIAEALGHEYGNSVTGIYLEQFDLEVIDRMNEFIIKNITASSNHL